MELRGKRDGEYGSAGKEERGVWECGEKRKGGYGRDMGVRKKRQEERVCKKNWQCRKNNLAVSKNYSTFAGSNKKQGKHRKRKTRQTPETENKTNTGKRKNKANTGNRKTRQTPETENKTNTGNGKQDKHRKRKNKTNTGNRKTRQHRKQKLYRKLADKYLFCILDADGCNGIQQAVRKLRRNDHCAGK